MKQPDDSVRMTRADAERKLLAALCQATADAETRATILRRFQHHVFAESDHEVIYRALATMPPSEPAELQLELTRAMTRLGFPDVDLGAVFHETAPRREEIIALLSQLQTRQ